MVEVNVAIAEDTSVEGAAARISSGKGIVKKHVMWAAGLGLVPIPLWDFAAVFGVQVKMVATIAESYGVDFSEETGKTLLISLFSGWAAPTLAWGSVGSIMKGVPGIGYLLGAVTMPLVAGAFTYATGMVFIAHFETGGTLLDFDPEAMQEHFRRMYAEGKEVAGGILKDARKS